MPRGTLDRALLWGSLLGGVALFVAALVLGPSFVGRPGFPAPFSWHLFYFHVPAAFITFLAFGLAFYHSLHYLARPDAKRDHAAQSAVEAGVVYAAITLATGSVWARAEWGPVRAWWTDAKLVLVLVTFLVYTAYLFLRREIEDPDRRARVAAVYAVAAVATIPLTWFAHKLSATVHPVVFAAEDAQSGLATPGVLPIFLLGLAVFTTAFLFVHRWRQRILALHAEADELEDGGHG